MIDDRSCAVAILKNCYMVNLILVVVLIKKCSMARKKRVFQRLFEEKIDGEI